MQFEIINEGIVATSTPHWNDNVYLSLDNTLSEDDILLASVGNQSALQPGASYLSSVAGITIPKDKSGPYYLIVETNVSSGDSANSAMDEYPNGTDNTLAYPITIEPFLPSDPVVSNVIVPSQVIAGSQVQVTYTVTNLGLGPTDLSSWTDGVWLVTDKTKAPYVTGTLLTSVVHNGALSNEPGDPDLPQSYTDTLTVTIPDHTSGDYFLVPQTDLYQQLDATMLAGNVNPDDPNDVRSDNFKAAAVTILPQPPPDLIVTAVEAPAIAAAGTSYTLSWSVTNQGAGATLDTQWIDSVYLSNSPTYNLNNDSAQLDLGDFVHGGALAPGQSYTTQETILLSPAYSGQYIIVYTNSASQTTGEGAWEGPYTNNNTRSVPSDIYTAPADLQVTSVVTQPESFSGEPTTVQWTVTNVGDPVWSGTQFWTDEVWFSPDPTFIGDRATLLDNADNIGAFTHTNAQTLGTGDSYTVSQTLILPAGIGAKTDPITYYIYIAVDPYTQNFPNSTFIPDLQRRSSTKATYTARRPTS